MPQHYANIVWDRLDCSEAKSTSPIVKMLRERNPDVFKTNYNNKVFPSITWKTE
jgi:hypothetical protein